MTDLARRRWLQGLVPAARDAVAKSLSRPLERAFPPRRRPPGAVGEAAFLALCTRCGECASACPQAAIHTYREGSGVLAGTPVLLPDQRPCHMCEGFPCAAACEAEALIPPARATWPLGEVRLIESRCIAFAGPDCGACGFLCPPEAPALRLVRGRPEIDGEGCVGCGRCIEACPVLPAAIELLPLAGDL
jgi:ferredoxin-type protein NapG